MTATLATTARVVIIPCRGKKAETDVPVPVPVAELYIDSS